MREKFLDQARILIVDDEPENVRYVQDVLGWAGYRHVAGFSEPRQALTRFRQIDPDLVILDLLMPGMDGFEVMEEVRSMVPPDAYLPILVLTSDITREARRKALVAGARDFLTKPMSPTEIRIRVGNLLETRFLFLRCRRQARLLASANGGGSGAEVERELLERWGTAIDLENGARDGHCRRVSEIAARLASALGLSNEEVETLRKGALLHDLGASTRLRAERGGDGASNPQPSEVAARVLRDSGLPALAAALEMALHRGERWDGSGRSGLGGEAIPLSARIVAVAERLAALPDDGAGGDPEVTGSVLAEIRQEAGSRFDPRVVEALSAAWARSASP